MTFSVSPASGCSDPSNRARSKPSAREFSGSRLIFQSYFSFGFLDFFSIHGVPPCPLQQLNFFCLEGWLRTMGSSTVILLLEQQGTGTTSSSSVACSGAQTGSKYWYAKNAPSCSTLSRDVRDVLQPCKT